MWESLREYVRAVFSQWVGIVGAAGLVLTLLDVYVGDVRIPPTLLWTLTGASLAVAQFRAFHAVRVKRDQKQQATRQAVPPEKIFELSDLVGELQENWENSREEGYGAWLAEIRERIYAWIDEEAPEFSASIRSQKGRRDFAYSGDTEENIETRRLYVRLTRIRDQLNARLSVGQ